MLPHSRFILRELWAARGQALILVLCVALSLTTLVALNSFKASVQLAVLADARLLHGGDIIIHSHSDFSPAIRAAIADLKQRHLVQTATSYQFYSVVRPPTAQGESLLLADIKMVSPGYPLYGRLELQSGREFGTVLGPGRIVVEAEVLDRLHLRLGDRLLVGSGSLRIVDVVRHEPDRPLTLFALGPRIFVAEADRDLVDLVKPGSRIDYLTRLKVFDPKAVDRLAKELGQRAEAGRERVETFRTASSGVKKFFDNLLFFLSLIGLFTLLLAGIGIQCSLAALLREREQTIAIVKALGAGNAFLVRQYLGLVLILGLTGSGLGIAAGLSVEQLLPRLLAGLLQITTATTVGTSTRTVAIGLLSGLAVVLFFTYLPLSRLHQVKPWAVFRQAGGEAPRGPSFYLVLGAGLLLLALVIVLQLDEVGIGLYFLLGAGLLIALIAGLTHLLLRLGARLRPSRSLALRQALRSLARPANASRAIVVTLAAALAVLLAIYLVGNALRATFVASYPTDAPNLFCLDIQTGQTARFRALVPAATRLYPVVRARLSAINGVPIDRRKELRRHRDNLAREFNLTYRDGLLDDEVLLSGQTLFRQGWADTAVVQVSILDTVAEMGDMHLDDLLQFNIQGVPLTARVVSIRTRTKSRLYPFFYFVFPEPVLAAAPQTFFAALKVEPAAIPQLENRIVAALPNVSVINMAKTAADLGTVLARLTAVVNLFALFSILAGGLIVVSSIFATRLARTKEAVYYKILGAGIWFVVRVFAYENLLLGLVSAGLAVALAQTGSWALCHYLLEIPYQPGLAVCAAAVAVNGLLVVAIGLVTSLPIIRQQPAAFLMEQDDG